MITNDPFDQILKQLLERHEEPAPSTSIEDAQQILQEAKRHQLLGRWEGGGQYKFARGTCLMLPSELERVIPVMRQTTINISMRLTLESAGASQLEGDGELGFDFRPLGEDFVKSVYTVSVDITGEALEAGKITLQLRDIEHTNHLITIKGNFGEDGLTLIGTYKDKGLFTEKPIKGVFELEQVRELPDEYEVITSAGRDNKVIALLNQASRSILVTHFTTEPPSDEYVSVMLQKLAKGVPIERIVAFLPDAPPKAYDWLRDFCAEDGSFKPQYTEYEFLGMPIPLDILVVDDEVALQGFATTSDPGTISFAICYYDRRVARHFRDYFKALKPKRKRSAHRVLMQKIPKRVYR